MKRVLCAWLPNWPLQQAIDEQPELSDARAAVVLYEPQARGNLRVVACSPQAERRDIRVGMTLAEASALGRAAVPERNAAGRARREMRVQWRCYDPLAARQALEGLARWCQQFSPHVGLEEAPRPESLLMDATGLAPLWGGEEAWLCDVAREFERRGFTVRAALADTMGAAWAVAHYASFSAVQLIAPGESAAALAPLPVAALRLSPSALEALGELGLERIEQVAALPRDALGTRLGPELLHRYDQALGQAAETIAVPEQPIEVQVERSFEQPTERAEAIEAALEEQIAHIAATLATQGRGIERLECQLIDAGGAATCLSVGLYRASAVPRHLWELVRLRLARVTLAEAVATVRVSVTSSAPLEYRQHELFAGDTHRDDPRQWASLIERLSSRLGREAVVRGRTTNDAQPEYTWRYEPWIEGKTSRRSAAPRAESSDRFRWSQRPLRLLPVPTALAVLSLVPDGPPLKFYWAGQEQRVARAWGPERIETGWWRGPSVRRDYYRVETATGQRLWIFRRLADGAWFWHGSFD